MNAASGFANNCSSISNAHHANLSRCLGFALLATTILLAGSTFSLAEAHRAGYRAGVHLAADNALRPNASKPPSNADQSNISSEQIAAEVDRTIKVFIETSQEVSAPMWDGAVWISNQILGVLADSGLDPSVADSGIQLSVGSGRAASVIAFGLIGVFLMGVAGPLYYSWKMWRLQHVRHYR